MEINLKNKEKIIEQTSLIWRKLKTGLSYIGVSDNIPVVLEDDVRNQSRAMIDIIQSLHADASEAYKIDNVELKRSYYRAINKIAKQFDKMSRILDDLSYEFFGDSEYDAEQDD